MKRKILSLILVFMLLPIASIFTACGKDKGYNLNNLANDFNAIATDNNNIVLENGKFVFDYEIHNNLPNVLNSVEPYDELLKFNYLFDNVLAFAYDYIGACCYNEATKNVEVKNQVEADLKELKNSVANVNASLNMFADVVNISYGVDLQTPACLSTYENLLKTYLVMLQSASNFSNSLANLYFNHILSNGNPDVFSIGVDNFDATIIVNKLGARLKYQISNLSQSFIETNLDDENFIEAIVENSASVVLAQDLYSSNVESINKIINVQNGSEIANYSTYKQAFYNLSVQAHNMQSALNDERSKFISACNLISYGKVVVSVEKTENEEMCVSIINSHKSLVLQYNSVLVQMLNIITGV